MNNVERAEHSMYLQKNHNLRTPELESAGMPKGWVVDGKFFRDHPSITERIQTDVIPLMPKDRFLSLLDWGANRALHSEMKMSSTYGPGVWALLQRQGTWTPFYLLTRDLLRGDPATLLEEANVAWNSGRIGDVTLRTIKEGACMALTGKDPGEAYLTTTQT